MVREKVLELLREICDTDEVVRNPDIELFETGLLDSFGTVQLLAGLAERLNVEVAPTQITREMWSTPNKIISFVVQVLKA